MTAAGETIEVLLATYNGEKFLGEQIDSILNQDYANLRILIRDDVSSDGTRAILEQYQERQPNRVRVLLSENPTGSPKGNFERLMEVSTAPFLMFADQDDVWDRHKASASMEAMQRLIQLHGTKMPLLVFTDLELVDADLSPLHRSFWKQQGMDPRAVYSVASLLRRNVVAGCTALLNRRLLELALPIPKSSFMHDWWIALLAAIFGKAIFLPSSTVRYRQHGGNAVGAAEQSRTNIVPHWNEHHTRRRQWEESYIQAQALLAQHGHAMPLEMRLLLHAYLRCNDSQSRLTRVLTLLRYRFLRPGLRPNLALLWFLWNKDSAV